ncbi:uncharacterized protein A4U43_C04F9660 [Asparagus officinalis]|uniref:Uncharacterized protein n=1 Tax=Asparagus officinalis TaxID=4686 RepID=A0A5P1F2A4_ASPOF|nr:uncharacterized protein A4U43_C04F9660 [Asparagus officinalis]
MTLRGSLEEDAKDVANFGSADVAMESIRDYLNGWLHHRYYFVQEADFTSQGSHHHRLSLALTIRRGWLTQRIRLLQQFQSRTCKKENTHSKHSEESFKTLDRVRYFEAES